MPGTPLPFTTLSPFVPESWVKGSILLPSCTHLPHKESSTRQDTCGWEVSPPTEYGLSTFRSQIRDQGGCVSTWHSAGHAVNGQARLPKQFLPHLSMNLYQMPTSCQICAKSQDPGINKANRICLPAACWPQEIEAFGNK